MRRLMFAHASKIGLHFVWLREDFPLEAIKTSTKKKSTRNARRNNKRVSTTQQIDCLCDKVIVTIVPSFCRSFALCTGYKLSVHAHCAVVFVSFF